MKIDTDELLAEHKTRMELWLSRTLQDIDSNMPPIMSDFYVEKAQMLGFLEAIELSCTEEEYLKAKTLYEDMCTIIEKIIVRAEPEIL